MEVRTRSSRFIALAVVVCAAFGIEATAASTFVAVTGHIPQSVTRATEIGRLPAGENIPLAISLKIKNKSALAELIRRQHTPGDALYGHYLTPTQFADRFAPSAQEVERVASYLQSRGLTITDVHSNRLLIEAAGTSAQVESAFQTELHRYKKANGHEVRAPLSEPFVENSVAPLIEGIVGLSTFSERTSYVKRFDGGTAQPNQNGQGTGPSGGLAPTDIKNAYNLNVSQNGSGETLALFELDGYTASDISGYANQFGIHAPAVQNVLVDGATGSAGQGAVEVTLDIELMMAVTPGVSKILVYEGPNSDAGVLGTYARIASDNQAREVSTSWGEPEADAGSSTMQSENSIFMQMASQGQSIFAAAGDSGAYDNGSALGTDDPASQPYVVGVGGTTLSLSSNGGYGSESSWSTPASGGNKASGGGGGISSQWSIPSWQSGLGTSANKGSTSMRMVPDVSLDANPQTGYAFFYQGQFGVVGGTSCAAPIWASFTAMVNQARLASGSSALGFADPALYQVGESTSYSADFHDVADGSTNLFYPAVSRFDLSTGWGSFNGANLLSALAGIAPPTPTPTPSPGPTPVPTPIPTPVPTPPPTAQGARPHRWSTDIPVGKPRTPIFQFLSHSPRPSFREQMKFTSR